MVSRGKAGCAVNMSIRQRIAEPGKESMDRKEKLPAKDEDLRGPAGYAGRLRICQQIAPKREMEKASGLVSNLRLNLEIQPTPFFRRQ